VLYMTLTTWVGNLALARSSATYLRYRDKLAKPDLVVRELMAVDQFDRLREILHPDTPQSWLEYRFADSRGHKVRTSRTGSSLAECLDALAASGVLLVDVSCDGRVALALPVTIARQLFANPARYRGLRITDPTSGS